MKRSGDPPRPPARADALLLRWLPDGVVGLSILGDLHQEFDELIGASAMRLPALWFWRGALVERSHVFEGCLTGTKVFEVVNREVHLLDPEIEPRAAHEGQTIRAGDRHPTEHSPVHRAERVRGERHPERVRQLLMESLALALLGGLLGLGIAWTGLDLYRNVLADIYKPYWIDFRMDVPVLLFSMGVTAVAGVAAGVLPAFRASGIRLGEVLKDQGRGASSLRMSRVTSVLVVGEIAVSCALLVGAGFMIRSVSNLRNVELGFETAGVMTGRIGLFESDYPDADNRDQFFTRLKQALEAEPGVQAAAVGTSLPGLGGPRYFLSVAGEAYETDRDRPAVNTTIISTDYFSTFGIEVVSGRDFSRLETQVGGDPVVIVNESFAERYLGATEVLGAQIRVGLSDSSRPWRSVVGVVPDTHVGGNVGGIGDDRVPPERIYLPQGAIDASFMSLAVKSASDPAALAPSIRRLVADLDPNLPVYDLLPLGRAVEASTWAFGLFGTLFTIFGVAALFLASVGLYGVMAFSVSQRRREMGVRMALGAEPPQIIRTVLGRGALQLAGGMAIGLALGALLSQSMQVIFYGVDTGDPFVYASIIVALATTGLLASFLPARAATRADPLQAMRSE